MEEEFNAEVAHRLVDEYYDSKKKLLPFLKIYLAKYIEYVWEAIISSNIKNDALNGKSNSDICLEHYCDRNFYISLISEDLRFKKFSEEEVINLLANLLQEYLTSKGFDCFGFEVVDDMIFRTPNGKKIGVTY
jgi:hypothetical protein